MANQVVVFAPHPDDEVLGCGGTIAKRSSQGYDISVVFMTDGRNCLKEIGVSSEPSPLELREIRRKEAERATKILGIPQECLTFLEIEDGTLHKNRRSVEDEVTRILKNFPADIYYPQEREFNIDHRATSHLVRDMIRRVNCHPSEHQYMIAWPYPLNLIPRVHPQRLQDRIIYSVTGRNIVHADITSFLYLKENALHEYRSQLNILSQKQKRPALKGSFLRRFLKNEESFLELR